MLLARPDSIRMKWLKWIKSGSECSTTHPRHRNPMASKCTFSMPLAGVGDCCHRCVEHHVGKRNMCEHVKHAEGNSQEPKNRIIAIHTSTSRIFENLRDLRTRWNEWLRGVGLRWTRWCFEHFGTRSSLLLDWALSQNDWWPQAVEFSQLGTANRIKTDYFLKREQEWTSRLHRHAEVPWRTDFPLKAKKFKTLRRRIERETHQCVCVCVCFSWTLSLGKLICGKCFTALHMSPLRVLF